MSLSSASVASQVPIDQMTVAQVAETIFAQSSVLVDAKDVVMKEKISGEVLVQMSDQEVDQVFDGQPFGIRKIVKTIIQKFLANRAKGQMPTAAYAESSDENPADNTAAPAPRDKAHIPAVQLGLCNLKFSTTANVDHGTTYTIDDPSYSSYAGAWCALSAECKSDFIYLTFQRPVLLHRLVTQGRYDQDQWVTQINLATSDLKTSGYGGTQSGPLFEPVLGADGQSTLACNTDRHSHVSHYFDGPKGRVARCVKITPTACHSHCSMRFELFVTLLD